MNIVAVITLCGSQSSVEVRPLMLTSQFGTFLVRREMMWRDIENILILSCRPDSSICGSRTAVPHVDLTWTSCLCLLDLDLEKPLSLKRDHRNPSGLRLSCHQIQNSVHQRLHVLSLPAVQSTSHCVQSFLHPLSVCIRHRMTAQLSALPLLVSVLHIHVDSCALAIDLALIINVTWLL